MRSSRLTVPAPQSLSGEAYRISPRDVGWAIYVGSGRAWKPALVRGGYKLGLLRKGADIVETDPIYRKNDANCCPSGGFAHTRWHWDGRRFRVVRTWRDSNYRD